MKIYIIFMFSLAMAAMPTLAQDYQRVSLSGGYTMDLPEAAHIISADEASAFTTIYNADMTLFVLDPVRFQEVAHYDASTDPADLLKIFVRENFSYTYEDAQVLEIGGHTAARMEIFDAHVDATGYAFAIQLSADAYTYVEYFPAEMTSTTADEATALLATYTRDL